MTPVRLEPATPRSRVKHSTANPLHSLSEHMVVGETNLKIIYKDFHHGGHIGHMTSTFNTILNNRAARRVRESFVSSIR